MQGWHITRFQAIFVVLHKHYYISFALWHEPSVGLGSSLFICVHAYLDTIAAYLFDTCVKTFTGIHTFLTTKTEWEVLPTSWKTQVIVCDQLCDIKTGSSDASHEASFLSSKPYDIPSAFQWPIFTKIWPWHASTCHRDTVGTYLRKFCLGDHSHPNPLL